MTMPSYDVLLYINKGRIDAKLGDAVSSMRIKSNGLIRIWIQSIGTETIFYDDFYCPPFQVTNRPPQPPEKTLLKVDGYIFILLSTSSPPFSLLSQ
jgi:hypothetical protein